MKRMYAFAAGAALAMILSGSGYAVWRNSDPEIAKRAVLEALNDPASATFSEIEVCGDDKKEPKIAIGKVNSRNKMGGMSGKQTFIVENLGVAPYAQVESDDAIRNPNIADAFVAAKITDTTFAASCSDLYERASQIVDDRSKATEVDMNATDEISTLPDNLAELDRGLM